MKRRLKQNLWRAWLLAVCLGVGGLARAQDDASRLSGGRLVEVGKGYSQTSVNTAIFRNSALVTHKGVQYISYYDAEGYLTLGKRKQGSGQWTLHRTQYKGNVKDAHNVISMMVDGEGYLHVAFDHHGQPLNYCRSVAPCSLELGEKEAMTGVDEENVTYPEFYRLSQGNLLFAYRSGASGQGNLVMNRYDTRTRTWSRVQDVLLDGEGERNAYWQLYVDGQGTIHLSWVWRETWHVETNHDLCYACSPDDGKTWYRTDGTRYELPIRQDNAEYACRIPQNSELINQTDQHDRRRKRTSVHCHLLACSQQPGAPVSGGVARRTCLAHPSGFRAYDPLLAERRRHKDDSHRPSADCGGGGTDLRPLP